MEEKQTRKEGKRSSILSGVTVISSEAGHVVHFAVRRDDGAEGLGVGGPDAAE